MTKKMSLREARYNDLPEISRLTARAFWDDGLLGDRIHPHREKYPPGLRPLLFTARKSPLF